MIILGIFFAYILKINFNYIFGKNQLIFIELKIVLKIQKKEMG